MADAKEQVVLPKPAGRDRNMLKDIFIRLLGGKADALPLVATRPNDSLKSFLDPDTRIAYQWQGRPLHNWGVEHADIARALGFSGSPKTAEDAIDEALKKGLIRHTHSIFPSGRNPWGQAHFQFMPRKQSKEFLKEVLSGLPPYTAVEINPFGGKVPWIDSYKDPNFVKYYPDTERALRGVQRGDLEDLVRRILSQGKIK